MMQQERDSLEDDMRTRRPRTVRTDRKIEEVAILVRANRSQSVDNLAAAVGVSHGTCYKILTDDLSMSVLPSSMPCFLTRDHCDDRMTICGDLTSSADDDHAFLNLSRNMVFPVRPATEPRICHVESASIATTEIPRQDRSKGKAMLELFLTQMKLFTWNSSQKVQL